MRVITNAKSVSATHHNPHYRSSLAEHTRRQIDLLQAKESKQIESSLAGAHSTDADADPVAIAISADNPPGVGNISAFASEPVRPATSAEIDNDKQLSAKTTSLIDYSALARKAVHIEPSPLSINTDLVPTAGSTLVISTEGPTLAEQQNISPVSFSSSTTSEPDVLSPSSSNIWQLDPTHALASIGLAFGLDTSPVAMSGQPGSSYGWSHNQSISSDRAIYGSLPSDRANNETAARQLSYSNAPGSTSYPPISMNNTYPSYSYYTPVPQPATLPRQAQDFGSIDPARLNNAPGGYMRPYDQGPSHSKLSPLRSPTDSPMISQGYSGPLYGDAVGPAGPSGSMSAREPTFNRDTFGNYNNGRMRRHSDDDPFSRSGGNAAGKRKATWSGGETDLASIKQELDFLAQTEREVAELKNDLPSGDRKERRRMQNRLAQRAFRARSKVHHQEVSKHITDLEDTVDSQGDHIDKLMALVERLQTENMLLRKATNWSSLGIGNDTPRLDDLHHQPPHHHPL